jgi:steroid 5-alpha reductase family enzyme
MLIRGGKHSPYLTTILAFIFCALNSYTIVEEILVYHVYPTNYLFSLRFLSGMIIFFMGFLLNLQADAILRNLRKDDNQRDYQIPRGSETTDFFLKFEFDVFEGGLFEYVSGANFLAESIEWTGYAICAWTLPALAFAVFTWANIAFGRAIHHHQYVEKKRSNLI